MAYPLAYFNTLGLFAVTVVCDYEKAHQEARKRGVFLMVLVIKPHDAPTQKIVREVLSRGDDLAVLQKRVVAVMVQYEGRVSYPIENYYTTQFPSLFVVNPYSELLVAPPLYGPSITKAALQRLYKNLPAKPSL